MEDELELPEFPKVMAYLWRIYHRLRRRMSGGFAGPNPIGWQDIDAFVRQTGVRLTAWDLDLLEAIDDAFLGASSAKKPPVAPMGRGVVEAVPFSDGAGVRAMMRSIGRHKASKKKGG